MDAALSAGLGYVPPDRGREGVVADLPIDNNVTLANLSGYAPHGASVV